MSSLLATAHSQGCVIDALTMQKLLQTSDVTLPTAKSVLPHQLEQTKEHPGPNASNLRKELDFGAPEISCLTHML